MDTQRRADVASESRLVIVPEPRTVSVPLSY